MRSRFDTRREGEAVKQTAGSRPSHPPRCDGMGRRGSLAASAFASCCPYHRRAQLRHSHGIVDWASARRPFPAVKAQPRKTRPYFSTASSGYLTSFVYQTYRQTYRPARS